MKYFEYEWPILGGWAMIWECGHLCGQKTHNF